MSSTQPSPPNQSERQAQSPTSRALIFTGGRLGSWALTYLKTEDYLIGADRGAFFLVDRGYSPDLSLGDFDSVTPEQLNRIESASRELISYDAVDKDWTDTELALREAIGRGYRNIVLFGALGTRFDHSLGNVYLLALAHEQGCSLTLIDEHNEISLCADNFRLEQYDCFPYVSLLPLTSIVTGVTLHGFQYPLLDATLKHGQSIGISNTLDAPCGTITIGSGQLLVIRSRD
ncbi:thiamine diphosphokinase [Cohnella endophytica]|uniref:Thiamine diphosphokinase n=1 Tax=Cohnella endophytica TaxID=2419778 RepID=A0A494Y4E7_9BACL|nr:thiamine diphosphokinase [Cohnella endophytica]RKP56910.1 thiamine diphosphokinase [Cohnella endophytica]